MLHVASQAPVMAAARPRLPQERSGFGQDSAARVRAAAGLFTLSGAEPVPMVERDAVDGGWRTVRRAGETTVRPLAWSLDIAPGVLRVRSREYRTPVQLAQREARARLRDVRHAAKVRERRAVETIPRLPVDVSGSGLCLSGGCDPRLGEQCKRCGGGRGKIDAWSAKSRNAMQRKLGELDYAPLFVNEFGKATTPAMITLTYPGDWQSVAPNNRWVRRHINTLRKRWDRQWGPFGYPLIGVWKREFQQRGAPHFHILAVPPRFAEFREWLAHTWAEIVGSEWCGHDEAGIYRGRIVCCERHRHIASHQHVKVVDHREGARASDPRRLAVYFAKHGTFSAKDYQNDGPELWADRGGVGRYWGVWGLKPAVEAVGLDAITLLAVSRVLRRWQRGKRFTTTRRLLRCNRPEWDEATGEQLHVHGRGCFRNNTVVVRRMAHTSGYLLLNDAPAIAEQLARVAAQAERDAWTIPKVGVSYWSSTGRRTGYLP